MCDTMGEVRTGSALFAKNSDRSPNEPQVLEYRPAASHSEEWVRCTYIEVEQARETHATLLSRPVWMWGAEMGVNGCGVCIGNEAVFTRGGYGKTGLTGMDLLRLALERAASAKEAIDVIVQLLERYGQGGDCGYDHKFYYDNSFLIMDRAELYILETAGKEWVTKKKERGSISNRLSITTGGDRYSRGQPYDFRKTHMEGVYSHFSGSRLRAAQTAWCIGAKPVLPGILRGLREHRDIDDAPLQKASVTSPCMHAGGVVGDHTTASMAVELGETTTVWATGASTPCIGLFKPWGFGNPPVAPVFAPGGGEAEAYWRRWEAFHRAVVGTVLPGEYHHQRHALERQWQAASRGASAKALDALSRQAAAQEAEFLDYWEQHLPTEKGGSARFRAYWKKKTAQLATPARPAVTGD